MRVATPYSTRLLQMNTVIFSPSKGCLEDISGNKLIFNEKNIEVDNPNDVATYICIGISQ